MKAGSDTTTVLVLLAGAAAAWWWWTSRGAPASRDAYWRTTIGTLPGELTPQERRALTDTDLGTVEGISQGAALGAVAGPWGAAIGAGAGAVFSLFK